MGRLDEFEEFRRKMNEKILSADHLGIKRFFALDSAAYEEGALPEKTKEMLGLSASMVLRCDDCISYHIVQCHAAGVARAEFLATSTDRCNTSVESFCWSFKLQRLTRPFIELTCHLVQVRLRVHR